MDILSSASFGSSDEIGSAGGGRFLNVVWEAAVLATASLGSSAERGGGGGGRFLNVAWEAACLATAYFTCSFDFDKRIWRRRFSSSRRAFSSNAVTIWEGCNDDTSSRDDEDACCENDCLSRDHNTWSRDDDDLSRDDRDRYCEDDGLSRDGDGLSRDHNVSRPDDGDACCDDGDLRRDDGDQRVGVTGERGESSE